MKKLFKVLLVTLLLVSVSACSNKNYENGEVQVFLPGEYISDDAIAMFEKETGIKCNITVFESNESMYTKLLTGATYDIVIPSDYMIERLIKEDMVLKFDKSKLTCLEDLYDGVKNMDFDPNNDYSIPYFWGNTGIVYDSTLVDEADVIANEWAVLKNPKYKGMIYMYDSIRDMFMIALKDLGYSMNTSNQTEIEAAYNWLCEIADTMEPAFASDECIDGLATGEKAMGFMYSGDAATILSRNENMKFYAPVKSGVNYFVDSMMILKDAKNVDNAYKFINFITGYDGAYENGSYVGYASVNKDVLQDLSSADFDGNGAYIPRVRNEKDEVFHNDEKTLEVISEYWTKVKFVGD